MLHASGLFVPTRSSKPEGPVVPTTSSAWTSPSAAAGTTHPRGSSEARSPSKEEAFLVSRRQGGVLREAEGIFFCEAHGRCRVTVGHRHQRVEQAMPGDGANDLLELHRRGLPPLWQTVNLRFRAQAMYTNEPDSSSYVDGSSKVRMYVSLSSSWKRMCFRCISCLPMPHCLTIS